MLALFTKTLGRHRNLVIHSYNVYHYFAFCTVWNLFQQIIETNYFLAWRFEFYKERKRIMLTFYIYCVLVMCYL